MAQSLNNKNRLLEKYVQVVREDGLNTNKNVNIGINGATANLWVSGNITTGGTLGGGAQTITSSSANALAVGPNGTTNPTFNVDASTTSAATGLNVKSAAAGAGLAVSVLSSGSNENLTIDAKGTGTTTLGSVSTGGVIVAGDFRTSTVTALGTTGTVSLDPTLGNVFTITPTAGVTLNAASAPAGQYVYLIVTTSGTSSFNITPTTNFKSTGALATGTVSGKVFTMTFISDGTNLNEVARTTAM